MAKRSRSDLLFLEVFDDPAQGLVEIDLRVVPDEVADLLKIGSTINEIFVKTVASSLAEGNERDLGV